MYTEIKTTIKHWLVRLSENEKIPKNIIALNFNISEPYGISLIGSWVYDENNDDWACNEDFIPENFFISLDILEGLSWEQVLKILFQIFSELLKDNPGLKIFQIPYISIGFVDGDLMKIK